MQLVHFAVVALLWGQGPQIPAPRGFVNDFAGVLDSATIARMDAVIREVRERTGAEIAVVTLSDLAGREASDVALRIGREWGVGAKGAIGDSARNVGIVMLLEPLHDHRRGSGSIYIAVGRGAEGFLTDARVGRIRDAMTPALGSEDYNQGLETGVGLIAQAIADEFHVTLTGAPAVSDRPTVRLRIPKGAIVFVVVLFFIIISSIARVAGRRSYSGVPWWLIGSILSGMGRGRGGWRGGGWGGGGGGGGFGGGFGGVGGGGGFSGGGGGGEVCLAKTVREASSDGQNRVGGRAGTSAHGGAGKPAHHADRIRLGGRRGRASGRGGSQYVARLRAGRPGTVRSARARGHGVGSGRASAADPAVGGGGARFERRLRT